jgi:hypothetical protein
MNVLVGCEFSGVVREAFRKRGHNAWSCDLIPAADNSPHHFRCDILDTSVLLARQWDLAIFFPPCTYLCSSGARWWKQRQVEQAAAISFVSNLWGLASIPKIAIENPIGILSRHLGKPTQIIQPYQFGEDASKATCLWLKNLPPLTPTINVPSRPVYYNGKYVHRWSNQTNSGQNKLPPSTKRGQLRSITYQGIANAMAEQWG